MYRNAAGLLASLALLAGSLPVLGADAASQGRETASAWLKLVDQAQYGESWDSAASFFKERISRDKWEATARQVRVPLGKLLAREVISAQYTRELPGAPDGDYVVVQFKTSFENKKSAVETVTPMKDKDGAWRVSGYFIR